MDIADFLDDVDATPTERGEFVEWVRRFEDWYHTRLFSRDEFADQWIAYLSTQKPKEVRR